MISFNFKMSEQGFMNAYFEPKAELLVLGDRYNCWPAHRCFVESDNVSIAHFTYIKPKSFMWKLRCRYLGISSMCRAWGQYTQNLAVAPGSCLRNSSEG